MLDSSLITLSILLPFGVFLKKNEVLCITAVSQQGSLGILPHRLDCTTALVPSIITFQAKNEKESFVAIDEGIFIKTGSNVLICVRNAIVGASLSQLKDTIEKEFLSLNENERQLRSVISKMESSLIHRFTELRHE
ncbi:MAG: F0F1 ATP synthase subunit epsilon [Myxococcales bacterium]|nr:F0F1 ATP synthase subunit epsilon [Myxococcales bacterium]USN49903.1 MAG: F0F1 ATP synthase subunit epsilon [Myxococcales bacterium]